MADDAVTVEQLRRWYLDTLRASVLATDPVRVTAWTGLAAEIRAALGDAGVVEPVQAPVVAEAVSPWRHAADDPPPVGVAVLCRWDDGVVSCAVYAGNGQWHDDAGPVTWPIRWVPL